MLVRAAFYIEHLIWYQPIRVLISMTFLCIAGVLAGTGTSVLLRKRHGANVLARDTVLPTAVLLLLSLADWALLRVLPSLRLSFSTHILAPLFASVIVRLAMFWGLLFVAFLAHWRAHRRGTPASTRAIVNLFVLVNLAFSAVQVHAYVVEPLLVDTTQVSLTFGDLTAASPVRVIHLSDTHIERNSYREASVVKKVNALQPDIIVLTGDYLNLSRLEDPVSAQHFRQFVSQLRASHGIYAVRGSVERTMDAMSWLVDGTDVVWLEQEALTVDVRGQQVTLVGVACSHDLAKDAARLDKAMAGIPDKAFTLLLYHSPDLIAEAVAHNIDLYLGGHTHGGQLRLPILGALVTGSAYGHRYVNGLFQEGDTQMYISRGVGFEGGGMPRARFLCPPEIVSLEIGGQG